MQVLINDYAGHPFQVQLSREMARRGHTVLHTYCANLQTPRGELVKKPEDPETFEVKGVALQDEFSKYHYFKRVFQEREFGLNLTREVAAFRPQVLVSANTPLISQKVIQDFCRKKGIRFVFWVQDLLGIGIHKLLKQRLAIAGDLIGSCFVLLEAAMLRRSDRIVSITEDFMHIFKSYGIDPRLVEVIQNWAPLERVPLLPKDNSWTKKHGLLETFNIIYSGTMGMKHNPQLLLEVALQYRNQNRIRVVVISEGVGANFLAEKKAALGLENLMILPFQPFDDLPAVLAAGDILVAVLEPAAGVFSVPSKVLTYMCAGRPMLLSVPLNNLAARNVIEHESGLVAPPDDVPAFMAHCRRLVSERKLRARLGDNARRFAEKHFDINEITDRFEHLLQTGLIKEDT